MHLRLSFAVISNLIAIVLEHKILGKFSVGKVDDSHHCCWPSIRHITLSFAICGVVGKRKLNINLILCKFVKDTDTISSRAENRGIPMV